MRLETERKAIVAFGNRMLQAGLTTGTGGNLSVFNPGEGLAAVTPSGVAYAAMRPEDVALIGLDGEIAEAVLKPSSEWPLHLALYRKRADIRAVVHTHSPFATTLACLRWEIPAVHYLVGFSGYRVPLAPYATFGTAALADAAADAIGGFNAGLLANHGLVAVGPDLPSAFAAAEEIEFVAQVYYRARCAGEPHVLSEEEMDEVIRRFRAYGQKV